MGDEIDVNAKDAISPKIASDQPEKKSKIALGRRLSRRLSIVTKVPAIINAKLKQELGSTDHFLGDQKVFDLTVIAPDKTQRIVSDENGILMGKLFSIPYFCFTIHVDRFFLAEKCSQGTRM